MLVYTQDAKIVGAILGVAIAGWSIRWEARRREERQAHPPEPPPPIVGGHWSTQPPRWSLPSMAQLGSTWGRWRVSRR